MQESGSQILFENITEMNILTEFQKYTNYEHTDGIQQQLFPIKRREKE